MSNFTDFFKKIQSNFPAYRILCLILITLGMMKAFGSVTYYIFSLSMAVFLLLANFIIVGVLVAVVLLIAMPLMNEENAITNFFYNNFGKFYKLWLILGFLFLLWTVCVKSYRFENFFTLISGFLILPIMPFLGVLGLLWAATIYGGLFLGLAIGFLKKVLDELKNLLLPEGGYPCYVSLGLIILPFLTKIKWLWAPVFSIKWLLQLQ